MEVVAGVINNNTNPFLFTQTHHRWLPLPIISSTSTSRAAGGGGGAATVVAERRRTTRTKILKSKCLYMAPSTSTTPKWAQKTLTLPPLPRGCHLITTQIVNGIQSDLSDFNCGLAHLFLQHTSASLTINENYDSDVRHDTETFLNKIVPEGPSAPWKHTLEGPDDMPAHIKSSMFGCALTIPITQGKLNMGTWQGIWLCEHRDYPTARKLVVTLNGI